MVAVWLCLLAFVYGIGFGGVFGVMRLKGEPLGPTLLLSAFWPVFVIAELIG